MGDREREVREGAGARGPLLDPVGPPDAMGMPRFTGPETFARLPRLDGVGTAAVAAAGVPFDAGVSYRSGARFGPVAIRASRSPAVVGQVRG